MDPLSLAARLREALADAVRDLAAEVPAGQVYVRPAGEFASARDLAPGSGGAVIVCETPGAAVTRRELLQRREWTFPVSVILACPANRILKTDDPARPASADWRGLWREAAVAALVPAPPPAVPECVRVVLDAATTLDLTQYEAANLWWTAINVRCVCRTLRVAQ